MKRTITLRAKLVGVVTLTMTMLLIVNLLWSYTRQSTSMEKELLNESRTLAIMMTSVWDFASINKDVINTSSSGEYDYKGLHCSLVGKVVGRLFSVNSDYTFRFVNLTPRNPNATPDEFEFEAFNSFLNNGTTEYYGVANYEGMPVFRYVYMMEVKNDCLECHGGTRGEIDISGYPMEGWKIGDIAGAGSIIVPTTVPRQNLADNLRQNAFLNVTVLLVLAVILYLTLSRLVLTPMENLQVGLRSVAKGDVDHRLITPVGTMSSSREISSIFYSFNNMAEELSELYHGLESRVVQRTDELEKANRMLELQGEKLRIINEQLQNESQFKTDFLAMVSHELRTPLTSILAYSQLLRSTLDTENDDANEQLVRIINNSHQLLELINNLLDTLRIESGKWTVQNELVDLYDTVGETVALIDPLVTEKNLKLQVICENEVPLIESDPELLFRALQNLLSNAVKFTPEGGSIKIHLTSDEVAGTISIAVSDTGIGISPEQQQIIFDRFVQGNMSMSRTYGGSGLGLALCREISTLLGGSIRVESELEQGSVFTLTLPAISKGSTDDVQSLID